MKKKTGPKKKDICAICGKFGPVTRDHLPPQSLFKRPLPVDLLTVSACQRCNGNANSDDEYFRNAISMSEYQGHSEDAIDASEAAIRSIVRSKRHRAELSKSLKKVVILNHNNEIVSERMAYNIDAERISRVIRRIYRGIFFVETGRVLKRGDITVDVPESFAHYDAETQDTYERTVLKHLQKLEERTHARGLFRYKFLHPDESIDTSACWMAFYNTLPVVCMFGDMIANEEY